MLPEGVPEPRYSPRVTPIPTPLLADAAVALAAWEARRPGATELAGDALAQAVAAILDAAK